MWSWASMGVLVVLVCALGVLQYRWIGEISEAEQKKLREDLRTGLSDISRDFNSELSGAVTALTPSQSQVQKRGREQAYADQYASWTNSAAHPGIFARIAIAWGEDGRPALRILDRANGTFTSANWPDAWSAMRDWVAARSTSSPDGRRSEPRREFNNTMLIDVPRFGEPGRGGPGGGSIEQDWLLADVDPTYSGAVILPELLARHLGTDYRSNYRVVVVPRERPSELIFKSASELRGRITKPDDSVLLFSLAPQRRGGFGPPYGGAPPGGFGRGPGPGPGAGRGSGDEPGRRGPDPGPRGKGPGPFRPDREFRGPGDTAGGRWELSVQLMAGSLEAFIARARQRNLAVSGAILLLVLVTAATLLQFTRQTQRLAEVEMEFVAGVSHELRTPLTVIRTAAFNLRGKLAGNPSQVERYGTLIQQESEKLTAILEQVLQFASNKTGRVTHERVPISIDGLIDNTLQSSRSILEESLCQVEKQVDPELPLVMGDATALRHALQNLIGNAVKYGMETDRWIGVYARKIEGKDGPAVEIRIVDRGPGIPPGEQKRVFDAFFRGQRAVQDQIHGTGLGLNLVKKTIEAHGGTVKVQSGQGAGTTFIVRIPVPPTEHADEFTHSSS